MTLPHFHILTPPSFPTFFSRQVGDYAAGEPLLQLLQPSQILLPAAATASLSAPPPLSSSSSSSSSSHPSSSTSAVIRGNPGSEPLSASNASSWPMSSSSPLPDLVGEGLQALPAGRVFLAYLQVGDVLIVKDPDLDSDPNVYAVRTCLAAHLFPMFLPRSSPQPPSSTPDGRGGLLPLSLPPLPPRVPHPRRCASSCSRQRRCPT